MGVPALYNTAAQFDGATTSITFPSTSIPTLAGDFTIAAWINITSAFSDGKVIGNENGSGGFKMGIYNSVLEVEIRTSSNAPYLTRGQYTGTTLVPGTWYFVVGIYSQSLSYMSTYVNGVEEGSYTTAQLMGPVTSPVIVGREPFANSLYFNGLMEDISIYSRVLTNAEIQELYLQSP